MLDFKAKMHQIRLTGPTSKRKKGVGNGKGRRAWEGTGEERREGEREGVVQF